MRNTQLEDLLAIKWHDGLLVHSGHLTHVDARTSGLMAAACSAMILQPGLLEDDPGSRTLRQLISIDQFTAEGDQLDVSFEITRGFRALSSTGALVIGVPNKTSRSGVPTTTVTATMTTAEGDQIVCVRQRSDEELRVMKSQGDNDPLGLEYPRLDIDIVPRSDITSHARTRFGDAVPIGVISYGNGKLEVDSEYIPPVLRLTSVSSFDENIVGVISTLLLDLYASVSQTVEGGAAATVGAGLMSRVVDYQVLKSFLLGHHGTFQTLAQTSPTSLLLVIMKPIAVWWREHYEKQFKTTDSSGESTGVKRMLDHSNELISMTPEDLFIGTGELLYRAKDLLEGLNSELSVIA